MTKPLIALPASRQVHKARVPNFEVNELYVQAILSAGGLPVLVPASFLSSDWQQLVECFDGFLFSGGGDVDPRRYGGMVAANSYGFSEMRDTFELGLIPFIVKAEKPILGICRGAQVLNVALGGTLIGDIASEVPAAKKHDWYPSYARDKRVHDVNVLPETRLSELLNQTRVSTNSLHHQAIKAVGQGLVVSAMAEDGVVEAIELAGKPFTVGVQWHPEHLQDDPAMRSLFKEFIRSAAG